MAGADVEADGVCEIELSNAAKAFCAEFPLLFGFVWLALRLPSSVASAAWADWPPVDTGSDDVTVALVPAFVLAFVVEDEPDALWETGFSKASTASWAVLPVGVGACRYCANVCSETLPLLFGSSWA